MKNTLSSSVIIPIYNEDKALSENRDYYDELLKKMSLLLADNRLFTKDEIYPIDLQCG